MTRYRLGRIIVEFGYPCGNTFIPDRQKCWTDPKTGAKLKVPLTKEQIEKVRGRSLGAEKLYAAQENRILSSRKDGWRMPKNSFPGAKAWANGDYMIYPNSYDANTNLYTFTNEMPDGRIYEGRTNTDLTFGRSKLDRDGRKYILDQFQSELASKEVADKAGLGKYFVPVKIINYPEPGYGNPPAIVHQQIEGVRALQNRNEQLGFKRNFTNDYIQSPKGLTFNYLDRMKDDLPKIMSMDYITGNVNRGLPILPPKAGAYLVDNGLNFSPSAGSHRQYETNGIGGRNSIMDKVFADRNLDRAIDKSILKHGDDIIAIARKHRLPTDGIYQRLEAMNRAQVWKHLL